jgi:rhodanese-related sulfurtransferase
MDGTTPAIPSSELYAKLGTVAAPLVVDVRREADFISADSLIVSAFHQTPEQLGTWTVDPAHQRRVIVYCVHGRDVSQSAAAALRARGVDAAYLEGGIAAWTSAGLPTRRKRTGESGTWMTRERPKIDRIACPWLIRRFVDPYAAFLYVPAAEVITRAKALGATPYDVDGVEFTHEGERCSFDTIIRLYGIKDSALDRLATIVRGADTSRHDLSPQCGGLFAISLGLSANIPDDHAMLAHGMVMYDALYTWCRSLQAETHNWPAKRVNAA